MITLFTSARPFVGHTATIQRNAIKSWMLLRPNCEIILLGPDAGSAEISREFGLRHIPDVELSEFKTPLIDDIFRKAQSESSHQHLCYVNADDILMSDFSAAIVRAISQKPWSVTIGRRWDLAVPAELDFSAGWEDRLRKKVASRGRIHSPCAIEYIVFPKGLYQTMPQFSIGRWYYDWWLVREARDRGVPVIDASRAALVVHQSHEHTHISGFRRKIGLTPEARRNRHLMGYGRRVRASVYDAAYLVTSGGLRRKIIKNAWERILDLFRDRRRIMQTRKQR